MRTLGLTIAALVVRLVGLGAMGYGIAWGFVGIFAVPFMLLGVALSPQHSDKMWFLWRAFGMVGLFVGGIVVNAVIQAQANKIEVHLRASREHDKLAAAARCERRQAKREAKRAGCDQEEDESFFDPREPGRGAGSPAVVFKLFQQAQAAKEPHHASGA